MENKQSPSKKKLISIQEEKLIREVDYDILTGGSPCVSKKQLVLDLEILQKGTTHRQSSQKVVISIKPRPPAIKTIYIAEKSRFSPKKGSDKSGSRLAIGDHSSFTTHLGEDDSNIIKSPNNTEEKKEDSTTDFQKTISISDEVEQSSSTSYSKHSDSDLDDHKIYNATPWPAEKCYIYAQPQLNMNLPKLDTNPEKPKTSKVDIATFIVNSSSDDSAVPTQFQITCSILTKLHNRIQNLERRIMRQEMVFRSIDPNLSLSSSDDDSKDRTTSKTERPGCSYIEQYSHIPETSAFQKYAQQTAPLSPSKAATLEKEHNSEQYGRDFTTYDGITARGRRQCASVPCKRENVPKMAAERVHKIRHKLNPVRDYRLMDTVHYLAQGEFAPRDDGIKLTPSREAVLSDIIYEDVCRTHWPNTRLGRRVAHSDRCSTRCELQRLIDSLLRERVAHVERRRRRHYRIVKLNHRHESCRPMGKTGDIIVASHKNKQTSEERGIAISDHNAVSAMIGERRWEERSPRRNHRSHDRLMFPDAQQRRHPRQEDCPPGPSYQTAPTRPATTREATCCYHTSSPAKTKRPPAPSPTEKATTCRDEDETSGSSMTTDKIATKTSRIVVKKEHSRRKCASKEEPDLEHYILLPTLVIRTPSNVKRQKKFNDLYRRILNVRLNNVNNNSISCELPRQNRKKSDKQAIKKDIGFNINITLSDSSDHLNSK